MKIKLLVFGSFLAGMAATFQIIPAILGEAFIFLTLLSSLPIFIAAKTNPSLGASSCIAASIIICIFSIHEGIFFIFTNAPVGLSLGILFYKLNSKMLSVFLSSIILTVTLSIMNYAIGIQVFGATLPGGFLGGLSIILLFSMIYNIFYLCFARFVDRRLERFYNTENKS